MKLLNISLPIVFIQYAATPLNLLFLNAKRLINEY